MQFGETIFICVDTSNDQLEYEHSKEGNILRKLCWSFDGCQSTWEWVEGEPEPWEDLALFSEENFDRAREIFKYNEHLELLAPEELLAKEKDLRTIWDHRQYMLGDQWPLGDATIGISIQKYFGLKSPLDDLEESAF
ncbi:hypothetical protein [Neosynechococcus sphagnicola]|uniref:hypothetical protein n=1 Tax=Neosynechococcus sphagnicola TaxID=1501145 RepID=UPI0012E0B04D|nr:hypothetical protein [Neosynechococcus sphagnicola]